MFSKIHWPTPEELRLEHEELLRTTRTLAQAGWTLSMYLTVSETHKIAKHYTANGQNAVDQWFVHFYNQNNGSMTRNITEQLVSNQSLREWHPVLEDCIWAYESNRYRLVVAAMLPILEGVVAKLVKCPPQRNKKSKLIHTWNAVPREPWMLDEIFWTSVDIFIRQIWRTYDFDKDQPSIINRNWVLHGRMPAIGGQADALRLFAATEFIADYLKDQYLEPAA